MLGPAHLTLKRDGLGDMRFFAIEVGLDYRVVQPDGRPGVEFSFDESDEGDGISGRGWAVLEGDQTSRPHRSLPQRRLGVYGTPERARGSSSGTAHVTRTPALVRLEKKLTKDPCAILSDAEIRVRVLDREVRRVLVASFPRIEGRLAHSEDSTRWHVLGARCAEARGGRGIRDVSVALGIPQYRLRAIEGGRLREIRADLAQRYFHFLDIEEWVARWCRANRELATRVGLLNGTQTRSRRRD